MDVDSCKLMRADGDNTSRLVVLEMQFVKRETRKEGPRCQGRFSYRLCHGPSKEAPSIADVLRTASPRACCPTPVRPPGARVLDRGARWPDRDSRTLHRGGLPPHTERHGRMPSSAKCR